MLWQDFALCHAIYLKQITYLSLSNYGAQKKRPVSLQAAFSDD
jgi:hypothetical protein